MSDVTHVLVLMTTYNGERYVAEQVRSILEQSDVDLTLRICDDGSTDATCAILEELAAHDSRIELVCNTQNKGCSRNFMDLIYTAEWRDYDFIALSDQDDVWLSDKLKTATGHMALEAQRPELYYAGVDNVDNEGRSLGNEYSAYRHCAQHPASLLLVQNWCLGCTLVMNGPMVALLQMRPVYDFARMYDAWIHAVALFCGAHVICDLEHSYIKRRISGDNLVGLMNEKRSATFLLRKALHWLIHRDEVTSQKHTQMARCLLREYREAMDASTAALVEDVAARQDSFAARRRLFMCKDIVMTNALRTIWLRAMVLLGRF